MPNTAASDLESYWMPFTANRQFKNAPRLLIAAEGMYHTSADGRQILDGTAGMWCVNAGHGNRRIIEAVQNQVAELDYSPAFQMGHPKAFQLANRVVQLMPGEGFSGRIFRDRARYDHLCEGIDKRGSTHGSGPSAQTDL